MPIPHKGLNFVPMKDIKVIAFDADDTLWALQNHFEEVEKAYCNLLSAYDTSDAISASLFSTESHNMSDLGYGCKAFIISLVENAISISQGRVTATEISQVIELGKSLLHVSASPLPGVKDTLKKLHSITDDTTGKRRYKMVVFTKGELMDQENKLHRSGLLPYFDMVRIVSDKTPEAYRCLCTDLQVSPKELLMVGNSLRSDILPALEIGAWAVHVPFSVTWEHEKAEMSTHEHLRPIVCFSELISVLA